MTVYPGTLYTGFDLDADWNAVCSTASAFGLYSEYRPEFQDYLIIDVVHHYDEPEMCSISFSFQDHDSEVILE